jgi:adenylate cyclase
MQAEITKINHHNGEQGLPEISIGIGLHSGEVVAGNIGSERRSKYAVVGHNVNLTARIESYTNGGEILISESTLNAVGPRVHTGRQLTAQPKGMADAVTVYAVTGIDSD